MSRIGKMPIEVPSGVEVKVSGANDVSVKGPKGTLSRQLQKNMIIKQDGNILTVERPDDTKANKSLHGLTRTLLSNMVVGVSAGFTKELDINGVGYRAQKQGKKLVLSVGYSHPVEFEEENGITLDVPAPNKIIVMGIDKQAVGQIAAEIRETRPPEPYKGKGIKYSTEHIRRKEGKTGAKSKK